MTLRDAKALEGRYMIKLYCEIFFVSSLRSYLIIKSINVTVRFLLLRLNQFEHALKAVFGQCALLGSAQISLSPYH